MRVRTFGPLLVLVIYLVVPGCADNVAKEDVSSTDTVVPVDATLLNDTTASASDTGGDAEEAATSPDAMLADTEVHDSTSPGDVVPEPKAFFDPAGMAQIELVINDEALTTVTEDEHAIFTAELHVGEQSFNGIQASLYGPDGSFRKINEKAGFLIQLAPDGGDATLDGRKWLILDNLERDRSMIREHLGNLLFREMGIPAPKTTYAWLKVNGEDWGLYLAMEWYGDPYFQSTWFGESGGPFYLGKEGVDLDNNGLDNLIHISGDDEEKTALKSLVEGLGQISDETSYEELGQLIDMDRYLTFAAIEIMTGTKRGYSQNIRNYGLYQDPASKRWTLLPFELARTMRDGINPLGGNGWIQKKCLSQVPCRKALAEKYQTVADKIAELELVMVAYNSRPFILAMVEKDPRTDTTPDQANGNIYATVNFLASQPAWLLANLDCVDPALVDADSDGYSACDLDCDDNNPNVHPDAPEICNFLDDNCDGKPDNDDQCPQCAPYIAESGKHYEFCLPELTWQEAEDDCVARGGHLASVPSEEVQDELVSFAASVWWKNWWIGFNDMAEEGTFVWSDGSEVTFTSWANNEPNDSNGEDCGHFSDWAGGNWNDIPCDSTMPYICQLTTPEPPPEENPEDPPPNP